MSSSVVPSAARSKTWARATRRAAVLPLWIPSSRSPCSSSVRSTRYWSAMGIPPVDPTIRYLSVPIKTSAAAHEFRFVFQHPLLPIFLHKTPTSFSLESRE